MNDLQLMKSEKFGTIRRICEDGKVLYCGSDVAKALGYKSPKDAISAHCKGAVKRRTLTNGGKQELSFIPEADVYRLICHSKLPSALEFEKWVFEDVVPNAVNENLNPEPEQLTLETEEYHYFAKTLNGEPVITLADFEHFTGITSGSARHALYNIGKDGEDYKLLTLNELAAFKTENPSVTKAANALVVIKKSGADKLAKYFNCGSKLPAMIAVRKPSPVRLPSVAVRVLMEKVQMEARAIDGISHLLLCPDTVENFEKFRKLLTDRMHKLYSYCVEVAFVEN